MQYSQRTILSNAPALLVAMSIACAMMLGGGGSPEPRTEIALQLIFALIAVGWFWTRHLTRAPGENKASSLLNLVILTILAVPLSQLIPLPPGLWSSLPGREDQLAALALIGEGASWRPLSISPHRTIASLLAIVPALFCMYAVARLNLAERRLVLMVIVGVTIASAMLGVLQLAAGNQALNIYENVNPGWITGFQANRNATADILLIGFLALGLVAAPSIAGPEAEAEGDRLRLRPITLTVAGLSLLILLAVVMTGSRTGIALIPLALGGSGLIYLYTAGRTPRKILRLPALLLIAAAIALGLLLMLLPQITALGRVAGRFGSVWESGRFEIWKDSWFAAMRYWPFGYGLGGFEPAMYASERLEALDVSRPNRAHNDFLELILESGVFGIVAIIVCLWLIMMMALRVWRHLAEMRPSVAFSLTCLLLVALHSIVDYPLRSMSLACLAGLAVGLLTTPPMLRVRSRIAAKHDWDRIGK